MLKGIAVSGGFAIGKILKLKPKNFTYQKNSNCDPQKEHARFKKALCDFTLKTEAAAGEIRRIVGHDEAEIFTGHIYMAHDPDIEKEIKRKIAHGFSAEMATESACDLFIEDFLNSSEEFTKQRAADIKDIKHSFLSILTGEKEQTFHDFPFGTVLAAHELTPSAVNFLDRRRTVAVVTERGDSSSHFAILARAMGIPAVLSVPELMKNVENSQRVIVDGTKGEIIKI